MDPIMIIVLAISFLAGGFILGNMFPVLAGEKEPEEVEELVQEEGEMEKAEEFIEPGQLPSQGEMEKAEEFTEPGQPSSEEEALPSEQADHETEPPSSPEDDEDVSDAPVMVEQAPPRGDAEEAKSSAYMSGLVKQTRLWHDPTTKDLVVEIDGLKVSQGGDLSPEQHGRLSRILIDLQDWIGLEAQLIAAEVSKDKRRKTIPLQTRENRDTEPVQKGWVNPVQMLRKAVESDASKPIRPGLVSIIEQIDEILQEKLEGTYMEDMGIQLKEIPGKGMTVKVGLDTYDEVADVPSQEIREIIRSAVEEWENLVSGESG